MIRRLSALALCILIVLAVQPARAAIDDAGAQRLKTIFQKIMDDQKAEAGARGVTITYDGALNVEKAGTYYAVTFPHTTARRETDGVTTTIGMIAINAMPGATPEQWKMSMALPTPITVKGPEGTLTIAIGGQNFAGIWHEQFNNFTKLNAQYKNIVIKDSAQSFTSTLPDFTAVYDVRETSPGLWSGPLRFTAAGLDIALKDGGKARIGKTDIGITLKDYSFKAATDYREKAAALAESYNAGEGSDSSQHATGLYNLVLELIGTVWDGFTMTMAVGDVSMTRPPIPGSPAGEIKLASSGLTLGMNGFRQNKVTLDLGLAYDKLSMIPLPEGFDDTTPKSVNINLSLTNLPYKEMAELGRTSLATATQNPQMAPMTGLQALMSLPQLMTQAGTTLNIRDTIFANDVYRAVVNGAIKTDLNAVKGGTGTATVEISGLDALVEALKKESQAQSLEGKNVAGILPALAVLQLAGQQSADKTKRTYNLELTKEGAITVNGTDINTLMPQAAPTPAPAPKTP